MQVSLSIPALVYFTLGDFALTCRWFVSLIESSAFER